MTEKWHKLGIETPCHTTRAANALLDAYAIEAEGKMLWNAQLHDMVDNIERQTAEQIYGRIGRQFAEPQAIVARPHWWSRFL